jgi:hypothetical protein
MTPGRGGGRKFSVTQRPVKVSLEITGGRLDGHVHWRMQRKELAVTVAIFIMGPYFSQPITTDLLIRGILSK